MDDTGAKHQYLASLFKMSHGPSQGPEPSLQTQLKSNQYFALLGITA